MGSLCSGYGGLELALSESLFEVDLKWNSEIDPAASRLLRERFPGVPNLGDFSTVDFTKVEPVQVLTMGIPCQPVSIARRQPGGPAPSEDERWLWPQARRAVLELAPEVVVFENVLGLLAAEKGILFAGILADLHAAGFRVRWLSQGACAVGAPHHRHRVFLLAERPAEGAGDPPPPQRLNVARCGARQGMDCLTLLPTPTAREGTRRGEGSASYWETRSRPERVKESPPLSAIAGMLELQARAEGRPFSWAEFEPAVRAWERDFRAPAPPATVDGPKGGVRLSARFAEWAMGLPEGWVAGCDALSHRDKLRLLGNGICVPQAAHALRTIVAPVLPPPPPAPIPPRVFSPKDFLHGVVHACRLGVPDSRRLDELCRDRGIKVGVLMREILIEFLDREEEKAEQETAEQEKDFQLEPVA